MENMQTNYFTINEKRIVIKVSEKVNKHSPNYFVAFISDSEGHSLKLHKIETNDPKEAMDIAHSCYLRSPFPKENLLEKMVEHHYQDWKEKEEEQEEAMCKIGAITFSVTLHEEEPEVETSKPKRATFEERFERARKAKELYCQEGATYKSVGDHFGLSQERIRQMVMFYYRVIRAKEAHQERVERVETPPTNGWASIADRHGWRD